MNAAQARPNGSSEHAGPAAIAFRGVVKQFGSLRALDQLEMRMQPGQILALLGPNGAGKTTTIDLCQGFLAPTAGSVSVLGLNPATQGDQLRPRIGSMPQAGGAYPGVRADEMLRLIASCAAAPLDPEWLLEVLDLQAVRKVAYKRLSGGQQQRLSLACALVGRPELVFLDEPSSGLDPRARRLVWQLVDALRRDGVSVLLTTHVMEEAEHLADQVVILDRGRVVAEGSPEELTASSEGQQQLRFRSRPGLNLDLLRTILPEESHVEESRPGDYLVRGHVDPQVVSAVTSWCARHDALAEELRVTKRNLEDVFLERTGRDLTTAGEPAVTRARSLAR